MDVVKSGAEAVETLVTASNKARISDPDCPTSTDETTTSIKGKTFIRLRYENVYFMKG